MFSYVKGKNPAMQYVLGPCHLQFIFYENRFFFSELRDENGQKLEDIMTCSQKMRQILDSVTG